MNVYHQYISLDQGLLKKGGLLSLILLLSCNMKWLITKAFFVFFYVKKNPIALVYESPLTKNVGMSKGVCIGER